MISKQPKNCLLNTMARYYEGERRKKVGGVGKMPGAEWGECVELLLSVEL